MIRKKLLLSLLGVLGVATMLTSCIGDEPLNAECDIEGITVELGDDWSTVFYHDYDVRQDVSSASDSICFILRFDAQIDEIPITLHITEGAQAFLLDDGGEYVAFQNGSPVDFSNERVRLFRIKSQDKVWERNYKVCFVHDEDPALGPCTMKIDFEDYELNNPSKTVEDKGVYYVWKDYDPYAVSVDQWSTGNPGFKLSKSSAKPAEYPSVAVAGGGVDGGACLKLETMDTGAFGRMVDYRLASGSLFIGTFDVANALKAALKATRFGLPFKHKPVKISGYYKFKAGQQFQDKQGNPVDRVDAPDAYCVVYRNQDADGNKVQLDGADVLTNENIVGLGRISGIVETDTWTRFEFSVNYTEELDEAILLANGYSMTLCFASSIEGAYFEGAPGTTFYVDKVTMECEY